MDRATRFIANRKQDKIRVVREQPSIQSMREGEEVLYFRNRGTLTRYRKERGKLWTSDMHGGRNKQEEGTFTASRLEYKSSFVDYRMFSHNFTDDLPGTKIYIPWQGTGEQTSVPESRASFLAPFDMTCHKIMIKIPEIATAATDIVFTIEKTAEGDLAPSTVCTFDFTDSFVDDSVVTINRSDWSADPTVPAKSIIYIGMNPDNANITDAEREFIITSVWKTIVTI
tara:strand:+ start:3341 stop:4021 length:681 start_codon:yes stop_codon:yes gene_type:complete